MKKIFFAFLLLLVAPVLCAQSTTTVSGTVTDQNGQVFANGSYTITFTLNGQQPPLYQNGVLFTVPAPQTGTLNGSGAFSGIVLPSNGSITPVGTAYSFKFCPLATSPCFTLVQPVAGATQNLNVTAVPISVNALAVNQLVAYQDAEISGPQEGTLYWNNISATLRVFHSGSWTSAGGGGGGTPCVVTALSLQFNNAGTFGCVSDLILTAPHTITLGSSGIFVIQAGATVTGITNAMLPTSGVTPGSYTSANITVNAQGVVTAAANGSGGGGGVTSFSTAGSPCLTPLFSCSVATPTTTPQLSFTLLNAGPGTLFGNPTVSSAGPIFTAQPALGAVGGLTGSITFNGSTNGSMSISGSATQGGLGFLFQASGGFGSELSLVEGTPGSLSTGQDNCYADSILHGIKCAYNAVVFATIPRLTGALTNGHFICDVNNTDMADCGTGYIIVPANGGTGVASPTAHTDPQAEGASNFNFVGTGALTGQIKTASNSADPAYLSPGVPGRTVAGATDTILCDSATALRDRGGINIYTAAGGATVTIPDAGSSGCSANFFFAVIAGPSAGSIVFNRTASSTFTIVNGSSASSGATTFSLSAGQYASIYSPDNTNYVVREVNGSGGGGSVTTTGSPATGNLTCFSGATSITNCNLSGDATTSGGSAVVVAKINGTAFAGANGDIVGFGASNTPADSGIAETAVIRKDIVNVNGNNPLVINCAQTSSNQACETVGETTAATNSNDVGLQVTTLTQSTASAVQITQGAAGPNGANAPAILNVTAAAAGGAASASQSGPTGSFVQFLTGAGGAGGATTGNGGNAGSFGITTGAGGAAGGNATNNGGSGGDISFATGNGQPAGASGIGGSGGNFLLLLGRPGNVGSTPGHIGAFQVSATSPQSVSGTVGINAGTLLTILGVTGGADSNAAGTAGSGSFNVITAGNGGAGTSTNTVGGAGGEIDLNGGNGGASAGTGVNSNGGNIVLTPGAPGTGGSGTAGKVGVVSVNDTSSAGFNYYAQGTAPTTANHNIPANSIFEYGPPAVTAYGVQKPGVAATGVLTNNVAAAVDTQGFSGDSNHSTTVTIGSGTSIGSTQLCSSTNCPTGTYDVSVYVDITTACGTTGTYVVNLIYTDDQGSKTTPVNIQGSGSVPLTGVLTTTSTANFGQQVQVVRLTSGNLNYSTTATACGTAGPMVGKLYLSATPKQ